MSSSNSTFLTEIKKKRLPNFTILCTQRHVTKKSSGWEIKYEHPGCVTASLWGQWVEGGLLLRGRTKQIPQLQSSPWFFLAWVTRLILEWQHLRRGNHFQIRHHTVRKLRFYCHSIKSHQFWCSTWDLHYTTLHWLVLESITMNTVSSRESVFYVYK